MDDACSPMSGRNIKTKIDTKLRDSWFPGRKYDSNKKKIYEHKYTRKKDTDKESRLNPKSFNISDIDKLDLRDRKE